MFSFHTDEELNVIKNSVFKKIQKVIVYTRETTSHSSSTVHHVDNQHTFFSFVFDNVPANYCDNMNFNKCDNILSLFLFWNYQRLFIITRSNRLLDSLPLPFSFHHAYVFFSENQPVISSFVWPWQNPSKIIFFYLYKISTIESWHCLLHPRSLQ